MLEYTVMYTQFVEWLARCADRADPSDRFPLHIKMWQYIRKTVRPLPITIPRAFQQQNQFPESLPLMMIHHYQF